MAVTDPCRCHQLCSCEVVIASGVARFAAFFGTEAWIAESLLHYGPAFSEVLVPRRSYLSSLLAVVHPWDVPRELRWRVADFWEAPETDQATKPKLAGTLRTG